MKLKRGFEMVVIGFALAIASSMTGQTWIATIGCPIAVILAFTFFINDNKDYFNRKDDKGGK